VSGHRRKLLQREKPGRKRILTNLRFSKRILWQQIPNIFAGWVEPVIRFQNPLPGSPFVFFTPTTFPGSILLLPVNGVDAPALGREYANIVEKYFHVILLLRVLFITL